MFMLFILFFWTFDGLLQPHGNMNASSIYSYNAPIKRNYIFVLHNVIRHWSDTSFNLETLSEIICPAESHHLRLEAHSLSSAAAAEWERLHYYYFSAREVGNKFVRHPRVEDGCSFRMHPAAAAASQLFSTCSRRTLKKDSWFLQPPFDLSSGGSGSHFSFLLFWEWNFVHVVRRPMYYVSEVIVIHIEGYKNIWHLTRAAVAQDLFMLVVVVVVIEVEDHQQGHRGGGFWSCFDSCGQWGECCSLPPLWFSWP